MPFTPLHLGPGLLLAMLFSRWIDVVAVLAGSIILDLEPFLVIVTGAALPLHGISHTYLAAGLVSIPTSAVLWYLRGMTTNLTRLFGLKQSSRPARIYASCLVGTTFHVFLDSFLYAEMSPFYPILGNPFYDYVPSPLLYESCVYAGFAGLLVYLILLISSRILAHRVGDVERFQNA